VSERERSVQGLCLCKGVSFGALRKQFVGCVACANTNSM
jgi:hypothetical protein